MELWLDSMDMVELSEAIRRGRIRGVTTNPTLAKRAGIKTFKEYQERYLAIAGYAYPYPVSYQLTQLPPYRFSYWDALNEGCDMYKLGLLIATYGKVAADPIKALALPNNVLIKVPMMKQDPDMAQLFISQFRSRNIPVNATLVFNLLQAHLAADAGANYVSVFVGRVEDAKKKELGKSREDPTPEKVYGHIQWLLDSIQNMLVKYNYSSKLLVASVRSKLHVEMALKAGAPITTAPWSILKELSQDPLTDAGYDMFSKDAESIGAVKAPKKTKQDTP